VQTIESLKMGNSRMELELRTEQEKLVRATQPGWDFAPREQSKA
jgi:hypothetical protein